MNETLPPAWIRPRVVSFVRSRMVIWQASGRGPARRGVAGAALALVCQLTAAAAAGQTCPTAPPPLRDLELTRFYADAKGSEVDPALAEKHKAETAPLTAFLRHVTAQADKAVKRTKPAEQLEAATCGLAWLDAWAKGGALTGKMGTAQAQSERKWDFTGAALAYLKLKPFASQQHRASIEPWLIRLAEASWQDLAQPGKKHNNHWYWLGLGIGAAAIGADNPKYWELARSIMRDAARDIAADGSLPMELARGKRALHYHAFAVMPLVALARLGAAKGEDFYAVENGALDRLAALTARGLADPAVFDALAREPQERPVKPGAGWTMLYAEARGPRLAEVAGVAPGHRWLGGNVETLDIALRKAQR